MTYVTDKCPHCETSMWLDAPTGRVRCIPCQGQGGVKRKGDCRTCGGSGYVACGMCGGTGELQRYEPPPPPKKVVYRGVEMTQEDAMVNAAANASRSVTDFVVRDVTQTMVHAGKAAWWTAKMGYKGARLGVRAIQKARQPAAPPQAPAYVPPPQLPQQQSPNVVIHNNIQTGQSDSTQPVSIVVNTNIGQTGASPQLSALDQFLATHIQPILHLFPSEARECNMQHPAVADVRMFDDFIRLNIGDHSGITFGVAYGILSRDNPQALPYLFQYYWSYMPDENKENLANWLAVDDIGYERYIPEDQWRQFVAERKQAHLASQKKPSLWGRVRRLD